MDETCQAIIDKQHAGHKLSLDEISTLMQYCIEILNHIEELTQLSISRAEKMLDERNILH